MVDNCGSNSHSIIWYFGVECIVYKEMHTKLCRWKVGIWYLWFFVFNPLASCNSSVMIYTHACYEVIAHTQTLDTSVLNSMTRKCNCTIIESSQNFSKSQINILIPHFPSWSIQVIGFSQIVPNTVDSLANMAWICLCSKQHINKTDKHTYSGCPILSINLQILIT